jgi:hypothetical protein
MVNIIINSDRKDVSKYIMKAPMFDSFRPKKVITNNSMKRMLTTVPGTFDCIEVFIIYTDMAETIIKRATFHTGCFFIGVMWIIIWYSR